MKTHTLIMLLIALSNLLNAQQSTNWSLELSNAMALQAQGKYKEGVSKFSPWYRQQPREALEAVKLYEQDSEPLVRKLAFNLLYATGRSAKDTAIRSEVVYRLTAACNDENEIVTTDVARYLQYFRKSDFSNSSRARLMNALKEKPALIPKFARLAGFVEIKELVPVFKEYANDPTLTNRQKWEAWLALARMGDKEAVDYVVSQVKTIPVNDDVMYQFAPDLVYTRQHKAFDYLIEILNSDKKDCTSSNPDHPGKMVCGFRVMEYLAPVVEGFPLKVHASGDIDAKDYNEALQMVRKWFKNKKGKYIIKTDTF